MKKLVYPMELEYKDDSKPQDYSSKGRPPAPKIRDYYEGVIEADERKIRTNPDVESTITGGILLEFGAEYYIKELKEKEAALVEKDRLIEKLMNDLDEFEMIRSFEFKSHDLPFVQESEVC
jgi:hypothetical protein